MTALTVTRIPARKPNSRQGEPCQGEVSEALKKWSARLRKPARCSFRASYVVNGTNMCERHAGKELLRLMLAPQVTIEEAEILGTACASCGSPMVRRGVGRSAVHGQPFEWVACTNSECPGLGGGYL